MLTIPEDRKTLIGQKVLLLEDIKQLSEYLGEWCPELEPPFHHTDQAKLFKNTTLLVREVGAAGVVLSVAANSRSHFMAWNCAERYLSLKYGNSGALLIVMVGLPRSGKTTLARADSEANGSIIVNPYSFRLAIHGKKFAASEEGLVWWTVTKAVQALFLVGHKRVILDATNTTRARRDHWKSEAWITVFEEVDTDFGTCLQRADNQNLREAITRMHDKYEPLAPDETTLHVYNSQIAAF